MKKHLSWVVFFMGVAAMGCEPNEVSFFVKHVKALPEAPDCSAYSVSDDSMASVTVDLALAPSVTNGYLVKNQLVEREDYDNFKAETNGILALGYEVSVNLASTNENVGGSNRFVQEHYIAPESEDVIVAITVPAAVSEALAEEFDCLPFTLSNYPADGVAGASGAVDDSGNYVPRSLGTAYATIRFFGRTQGMVDAETQDFTFPVNLCCGCSIKWSNCSSTCEQYCSDVEDANLCTSGVPDGSNYIDCRSLYHDESITWDGACVDDDDNPRDCTCDDC